MSVITTATDDSLMAEITGQDKAVLVYFHDPDLEVCEFMEIAVKDVAEKRAADLKTVFLNGTENPNITDAFSIPEPPVYLLLKEDTIMGYKIGKTNTANLEKFIDSALARPTADGVSLDEFKQNLQAQQDIQANNKYLRINAARKRSILASAIGVGTGIAVASIFASSVFGVLGLGIALYNATQASGLLMTPGEEPGPSKKVLGQTVEIVGSLASIAGSFLLVAATLPMSLPLAAAGVAAGAVTMFSSGMRFGTTIGQYLPLKWLLRSSLKKDAEDMAQRNPDRPLAEFAPPKAEPKKEVDPSPSTSRDAFSDKSAGKDQAPAKDADETPKPKDDAPNPIRPK